MTEPLDGTAPTKEKAGSADPPITSVASLSYATAATEPCPPFAVLTPSGGIAKLLKLSKLAAALHHSHDIETIAYYTAGGKQHISVLDSRETITTYSTTNCSDFKETASSKGNIRCMAVSPTGRHVVISCTREKGSFFAVQDWPLDDAKRIWSHLPQPRTAFHVTATQDFFFYSFMKGNEVFIACMNIIPFGVQLNWIQGTGLSYHRTINAMQQEDGSLCILVTRHLEFSKQKAQAHTPALIAIDDTEVKWKMSFDDLDKDAANFDLRAVDNDGRNFFVLNAKAKCVYVVSPSGQRLGRILQHLQQPFSLSVHRATRKLAVVVGYTKIYFYSINYVREN